MKRQVYSVTQINRYIRSLLEDDVILGALFVEGEVSNCRPNKSGHLYFSLKDEHGVLAAVMFKGSADNLRFELENGMKVIAYGRVSLYEKTGQYQLYAEILEPAGRGALQLAFEQLTRKLKQEGLFDPAVKQDLPYFPQIVALITSPTGAAVQDMVRLIKERNPGVSIVVAPAVVQGTGGADSIAEAIRAVNRWGKADVIILGRGGGSLEDLWCFNEEAVARAVFASRIPIVSAIGHETDITITDFVADLSAPTPSAATEIVPSKEGLIKRLQLLISRPVLSQPMVMLEQKRQSLEAALQRLNNSVANSLAHNRLALSRNSSLLESLSPLAVLKRGYALVYENKRLLTSAREVMPGQALKIQFHDGDVQVICQEKSK